MNDTVDDTEGEGRVAGDLLCTAKAKRVGVKSGVKESSQVEISELFQTRRGFARAWQSGQRNSQSSQEQDVQ